MIQPEDILGNDLARFVITKDNGFDVCWLFMGGDQKSYAKARRRAWVHANPETPDAQKFGASCGYEECIEPFHLYASKTVIGRMFLILENVERRGECLVWTGDLKDGKPQIRQTGTGNYSWVTVRRFTYEQEHNVELARFEDRVGVSCKTELCVEPRHLILEQPKSPPKKTDKRRCINDKHTLRADRVTCHVCKV